MEVRGCGRLATSVIPSYVTLYAMLCPPFPSCIPRAQGARGRVRVDRLVSPFRTGASEQMEPEVSLYVSIYAKKQPEERNRPRSPAPPS